MGDPNEKHDEPDEIDHTGVHTTHCCDHHGCKYGDDDCPVVLKTHKQVYPCESCGDFGSGHYDSDMVWHPEPYAHDTAIRVAIRQLLIDRGWEIDTTVKERPDGELREFIHPVTGKRLTDIDAVHAQGELECQREKAEAARAVR
jgi:hypothetical protein